MRVVKSTPLGYLRSKKPGANRVKGTKFQASTIALCPKAIEAFKTFSKLNEFDQAIKDLQTEAKHPRIPRKTLTIPSLTTPTPNIITPMRMRSTDVLTWLKFKRMDKIVKRSKEEEEEEEEGEA